MKITNNAGLPESIVRAVSLDDYDYEKAGDISASALSKSPRQLWLERRHRDEITEDAADLIWKLIGNIGHKIVERTSHPNTLVEERLSTTVLGWVLTGKFDLLYENGGYGIDDFKFTSVWAMKNEKPEWTSQLNTYAWLAKQHGFEVKRLRIIAVLRDWQISKVRDTKDFGPASGAPPDYPKVGVVVREVPLWSVEKQAEYIWERVNMHRNAMFLDDDLLPDCTDEERWAKPDTWAVKKKGAKRALRVFDLHVAAEHHIESLEPLFVKVNHVEIEHRPGNKTVKCDHYCPVNIFCNQYRALKGKS
jgi:hypothetical protein